jgi:hypothetical protein
VHSTKLSQMNKLLIGLGVVVSLYLADQYYASGRYTAAIGQMLIQIRHSSGV